MFFVLMTATFIFYVSAAILFVEGFVLYGGICLAFGVICTIILLKKYRKETKENCPDFCMHGSIPDCDKPKGKSKWDCDDMDCDMPDCFNCN